MPSFSIALTGLAANGVALDSIGNNLANLNTTAYKDQTTTFSDLFYQNIGTTGSGDALQVGLGTQVSGTSTDYSQGSLSTTTNSTDMALNGGGFFMVENGGQQELTRAGNFQLDQSGNLITTTGDSVMGYAATNGVVNPNTPLEALQIPVAATQSAQATSSFGITANLDAATGAPDVVGDTGIDANDAGHDATTDVAATDGAAHTDATTDAKKD